MNDRIDGPPIPFGFAVLEEDLHDPPAERRDGLSFLHRADDTQGERDDPTEDARAAKAIPARRLWTDDETRRPGGCVAQRSEARSKRREQAAVPGRVAATGRLVRHPG